MESPGPTEGSCLLWRVPWSSEELFQVCEAAESCVGPRPAIVFFWQLCLSLQYNFFSVASPFTLLCNGTFRTGL